MKFSMLIVIGTLLIAGCGSVGVAPPLNTPQRSITQNSHVIAPLAFHSQSSTTSRFLKPNYACPVYTDGFGDTIYGSCQGDGGGGGASGGGGYCDPNGICFTLGGGGGGGGAPPPSQPAPVYDGFGPDPGELTYDQIKGNPSAYKNFPARSYIIST